MHARLIGDSTLYVGVNASLQHLSHMHSHLEHFESSPWRNARANTNIAIISNPDSKLPALEHQVWVSRTATGEPRLHVVTPVNTALISCNANVQQDTEMSLKTRLYQSSSVYLQNVSPLCLAYLHMVCPHVAAHS